MIEENKLECMKGWFPPVVQIRENALRKIDRYSQLAPRVFKEVYESRPHEPLDDFDVFGTFELYGFTCRLKDKDITEDCFITKQAAYESFVFISPENVADALVKVKKINPRYKIDGHFHKHPEIFGVAPSHQDMGNIETVLAQTAAIKKHKGREISYSNMLITDGSGKEHYAMITDIRPCGVIGKRTAILRVLPGGPEVDDEQIAKEIKENINVPSINIGKTDAKTLKMELQRNVSKPNVVLEPAVQKEIEEFIRRVGVEKVIQYLQTVY